MIEIHSVAPQTVSIIEGIKIDLPAIAYVGIEDGVVIGSGGLAFGNGRCWVWLRLDEGKPHHARPLVRQFKTLISKAAQLGETEVWTPRDNRFSTSERLLTALGFKLAAIENEIEVWKCPVSN